MSNPMITAMHTGGVSAVVDTIRSTPVAARFAAANEARRVFGPRGEAETTLDDYVAIMRGAIDDLAAHQEHIDEANILSFNLSADLAPCWPDDTTVRERHHFEEGLRAAEDCIKWRRELGKPADRVALATWARGMHLLALGRLAEARGAFQTTCELIDALGGDATADWSFERLLYRGYLALCDLAMVNAAFDAQREDAGRSDDASFGRAQLAVVARLLEEQTGAGTHAATL